MAVFGAGEKTVFDKVKPVLEASFSNVMYTGGIGTAMIPKAMFLPLAKAVRSTSGHLRLVSCCLSNTCHVRNTIERKGRD